MILYEKKIINKKSIYTPVRDTEAYEGLASGYWLVHVSKKGTSIRKAINSDHAKILAQLKPLRDTLIDEISKACECRPSNTPITVEQKEAWENFEKSMGGKKWSMVEFPSIEEIVDKTLVNLQAQLYLKEK